MVPDSKAKTCGWNLLGDRVHLCKENHLGQGLLEPIAFGSDTADSSISRGSPHALCTTILDVPPLLSCFHRALHQDNVSVNLFVVNKPWLFSLLWCAGVDSVTTNDCQLLQQMNYPIWLIVRALGLSLLLFSHL